MSHFTSSDYYCKSLYKTCWALISNNYENYGRRKCTEISYTYTKLIHSFFHIYFAEKPQIYLTSHEFPCYPIKEGLIPKSAREKNQMPLFLSTYVNKVDKKGRISVPAPFRSALVGQAFQGVVLFKATNHPCIEGFDFGSMEELSSRLDHFDMFSDQQDDIATAIFAESVQCPFDGEGRINVPQALLDYAKIHDGAAFVGLGRKFQIWDSELFETRRQQARGNVVREGLTLPKLSKGDV